jgi:glycosyltransferase involved in cell wall biosynthesis
LGVSEKEILIGMMGRISYGKGYEDAVEIAGKLKDDHVRFLFIGGHSRNEDNYGERIEKEIKRRLGKRACLVGFRDDRERYLQALDIFLFPSYAESFGLSLTEAMACGLPCAAYGKDGVLDIIEDEVDGLLAKARDIEDLYKKTSILIYDRSLRERLGKAAREKVIDKFSDERMLFGFEKIYNKALTGE